jgi:predicted esterase YcpF (UPF0227 family)
LEAASRSAKTLGGVVGCCSSSPADAWRAAALNPATADRRDMPPRVLYVHGLESGPGGYKVVQLRAQGLTVTAPAMEMSLWDLRATNGLLRSLLSPRALLTRWPTSWLAGAMDDSFGACINVMREASQDRDAFDVLVGSSWGGAVSAALLAEGAWTGPAVLLCPALRLKEQWAGESRATSLSADGVTAALASLPSERKARCLLVHGLADETVPVQHSRELSEATGIALELVEGGSHGLGSFTRDGRLVQCIERVLQQQ